MGSHSGRVLGGLTRAFACLMLVAASTAHALTFEGATQKLQRALAEFRVRGVSTNIPFLQNVLAHPRFVAGEATTGFVDSAPELFDLRGESAATRALYGIEDEVRGQPPDVRRAQRQARAGPLLKALRTWLARSSVVRPSARPRGVSSRISSGRP